MTHDDQSLQLLLPFICDTSYLLATLLKSSGKLYLYRVSRWDYPNDIIKRFVWRVEKIWVTYLDIELPKNRVNWPSKQLNLCPI